MLRSLHRRYGQQVRFVSVYVREAHPGEHIPQPHSMDAKLDHARRYARRDRVTWTVAVDDLVGSLHHALGTVPDPTVLVDAHGTIAHTVLWSNDARGLEAALEALTSGAPPARRARTASVVPSLRGLGRTADVLEAAGPSARRDFRRVVPPVSGLASLARVFGPLPPVARSIAALVTAAALLAAMASLVRVAARRVQAPR